MALQTTKESLEDRLINVEERLTAKLGAALITNERKTIPGNYYKYELDSRITSYFERREIPFGKEGYFDGKLSLASINKEPLKAVELGMRRIGIPRDLVAKLDDFEKLYFFAGIEKINGNRVTNRGKRLVLNEMNAYEIVSVYIRVGIDYMGYLHNSILETNHGGRRRKVFRGNRPETYKNAWSPPHAKKIRKKLLKLDEIKARMERRKEELIAEFQSLFNVEEAYQKVPGSSPEKEEQLYCISERISFKLDSLQPYQLQILTSQFGRERVGQYAV